MAENIVKRLHISGLTPGLTSEDLSRRLSGFGTVKAVDGFGLCDGVGQPRKFGYVTLETTQGQLSRCLNLLSGSTWKGAKLRIGEAKPDYAQRLAAEREAASAEPPKKKRKGLVGREAADMSLVTPENVAGRSGWKVTPLGRILRPVRMRPDHPLPPPNEEKEKARLKGKKSLDEGERKKKRRMKEPDSRARRRTIDVTRYGSVHLKGMFLDMEVMGTKPEGHLERVHEVEVVSQSSETESEEDEAVVEETDNRTNIHPAPEAVAPSAPPLPAEYAPASKSLPDDNTDIATEKKLTLDLLASLFGNKDDDDWVGRESVGSDIDEVEIGKRHRTIVDVEDDGNFEVVPMDVDGPLPVDMEEEDEPAQAISDVPTQPPPTKQQQDTKLKDLFAPREEDAGFSLVGHLDLDLELDDEIPFATAEAESSTSLQPTSAPAVVAPPTHSSSQFNANMPLFFPHPASAGPSNKSRPKDIFDVAMEHKWHWRDPDVEFYRTGSEADIRKRWEDSKVELTKEWKRRWREAGKISRRRKLGDTGDT
ncbi:hypothetical protein H0H92_011711 [Tricholoma furcatifolium]|nr:hypothetical protein H0H92_011711 [Tricholoma furcatifolium]